MHLVDKAVQRQPPELDEAKKRHHVVAVGEMAGIRLVFRPRPGVRADQGHAAPVNLVVVVDCEVGTARAAEKSDAPHERHGVQHRIKRLAPAGDLYRDIEQQGTFRCDDDLWEAFEQLARAQGRSIDALLNEAMSAYSPASSSRPVSAPPNAAKLLRQRIASKTRSRTAARSPDPA